MLAQGAAQPPGRIRLTMCMEVSTMRIVSKIAIAAVLVSAAAAPALAQDWRYGGPRGYAYVDDGWSGSNAYSGPYAYEGTYAYAGEPYYGRRWYGPRYRYRYAPATSDYFHNSRQLQGTR
jgi:hypothetical protein